MIKVYTGPMFSGKSTNLILDYVMLADCSSALCFKPSKDTREFSKIRARNNDNELSAIVIKNFEDIEQYLVDEITDIFIDEVQFIEGDPNILVDLSIKRGIYIRVAGLSRTSEMKPFGHMPEIMAFADDIEILDAKCNQCGSPAGYTHCKIPKQNDVMVGNTEYEPLCFDCFREKIIRQ